MRPDESPTAERDIQDICRLTLSANGSTAFRNNVGSAWQGVRDRWEERPGTVILHNARPVKFGLCEGSSDLIGWTPIRITQKMVGTHVAVITVVEIKPEGGRPTEAQKRFLAAVERAGGIAILARSAGDILKGLGKWIINRP